MLCTDHVYGSVEENEYAWLPTWGTKMGNYINYCVYKRVNGGTKRFSDTRFNMPPESCVVPILVYIPI